MGCLFTLFIVSFIVQKLLNLIRSHLFIFCFYFHYSGRWVIEDLGSFTSESVLPMFSSRSFIVSGLPCRSLIHFEFIFVYGAAKCRSYILSHVVDQFSLVKEIVFSPLYILASFVKDKVSIGTWIYL